MPRKYSAPDNVLGIVWTTTSQNRDCINSGLFIQYLLRMWHDSEEKVCVITLLLPVHNKYTA